MYRLDIEVKRRFINKINFYFVIQATKVISISLYVKTVSTWNKNQLILVLCLHGCKCNKHETKPRIKA